MSTSEEEQQEKEAMDLYFDDVEEVQLQPLYETLTAFLANPSKRESELFFKQTKHGITYRGYLQLRCYRPPMRIRGSTLGNCLYITHVLISPRRGKFFEPCLRRILDETSALDSLFIEAIRSDKIVEEMQRSGWQVVGENNIFLKKAPALDPVQEEN